MSVILVAEQDTSRAQQIAQALRSAGWQVEPVTSRVAALKSAAAARPELLLVNADFPDASQLLATFSRSRGGPGTLVLVPDQASVAELAGDAAIAIPCSDEVLQHTVRQCLERSAAEQASPDPRSKSSSQQLTSADIFGDVLAEVEAEAERARRARRIRAKSARAQKDDLERRLEETLSGVLSVDEMRKRSNRPGKPADRQDRSGARGDSEIDALLDETLSSLDLPARRERSADSGPAPMPEVAAPATPPPDLEAPPVPPAVAPPETAGFGRPEPEAPTFELPVPVAPDLDVPTPELPPSGVPPARDPQAVPTAAPSAAAADLGLEIFKTQPLPIVVHGQAGAAPPGGLPPAGEAPSAEEEAAGGDSAAPTQDRTPEGRTPEGRTPEGRTPEGWAPESEGTVFGDYTLLDRVAVGGMAEVWRARRRGVEGFQKIVAIKKILHHLTSSTDFVKMFIDEAKLAAQLNHHNIIQIYDLGKVGEDYFIAMEYVEGRDLRSILTAAKERQRPVPIGLSLLIVSAVARALDYAHRKRDFDDRDLGLVHRDVSPQNVLISREGEIKLCDFGIVKAVSKASTTQMGALKGKLQYMSPEQAWGKTVDARSDIFSLGSVFFELLTSEKLFTGDSEISVLDAVRECRVQSPRELVPEIPEDVEAIVLKALAKDPDERYQTAGDLEHDIKSVLDQLSPTPGLKDLASYLHALFRSPSPEVEESSASYLPERIEAPAPAEPVVEIPVEAPPEIAEASVPEPKPASPPEAKPKSGRGFRSLLAAAVLAGVVAAAAFLALRQDGVEREPAAPAGGPPPALSESPVEAPGAEAPVSLPAAEAAADGSAGSGTPAAGEPTLTEGETDLQESREEAAASDLPPDLQQLVEDAVSKKREQIKEELERDFESQKRRLEEEIAKTRKEAEPPPPAEGGDGEGQ